MNINIEKLSAIARKDERLVIGLMSGTSMDGLDIALCRIKGNGINTILQLKEFTSIAYDEEFKNQVKQVFSKKTVDLEKLCLLNEWIAETHARMINQTLQSWNIPNEQVDLLASHGQTIYHAPRHLHGLERFGNATLQIGDGDHLAMRTGIITLSDFRQKHIAAGGEGAPLAAYGDYLLFMEKEKDVLLLNIGGIANFTWLPAASAHAELYSTDTGPGNTLMDSWMQDNFPGKYFDKGAVVARQGSIDHSLLAALKAHPFFGLPLPKTTGPELFNLAFVRNAINTSGQTGLTVPDIMHTLNRLTAESIAECIQQVIKPGKEIRIYVSGGGMHNSLLMEHLTTLIPGIPFLSTAEKNINPDAKEAILFAILANEAIAGNIQSFGKGANNFPPVSMGKISLPS